MEAKAPGKWYFLPHACLSKSAVAAKELGKWCCCMHAFIHLFMFVRKVCSMVLLHSLAVAGGQARFSVCFHALGIICYAVVWSLQQSVGPSWLWYSVLDNHPIKTTRQWKSIASLQQNWHPQPPGQVIHICQGCSCPGQYIGTSRLSCQNSLKLMLV